MQKICILRMYDITVQYTKKRDFGKHFVYPKACSRGWQDMHLQPQQDKAAITISL